MHALPVHVSEFLSWLVTATACVRPCLLNAVIGRGGEMINRLQADSAARIQVAPGTHVHTTGCHTGF